MSTQPAFIPTCANQKATFAHNWNIKTGKCITCGSTRCAAINRHYTAFGPPGLRCRNATKGASRFCRKHRGREKS